MTAAEKKRREMREAIRDAAIREFARNGLAGTSTQAIAQAAGITKAQLHYYISSKEELYQDVLRYIVEQWREIFFLAASPNDPATAIATYIERKLRHALEYPDVSRFFAREMARGAPEMPPHWRGLRQAVGEASAVIEKWIECGQIDPVDPLLFQINMWAVTQHYAEYEAQVRVLMDVESECPLDADRIIKEATSLFLLRCGLEERSKVS
ncbi:TetR family transcriptional regulator C-terminal domain-containing protein [Leisingera thetidis]|uniref:TetR family transcriptional regulator C-terminal domain-containing protein n=1 Tax=Leisingera thetidis TaxID=2930199 RepID=UPI0021F769F1|nr:TetR family transcriptional regulator C-terminal domain-containing protein [Leisingera thetidis]